MANLLDALKKRAQRLVANSAEGYRRAPSIQSPQILRTAANKAQQFTRVAEKYNPIQVLGKAIATSAKRSGDAMAQRQDLINQRTQGQTLKQRISRAPQQDENTLLRTGLQSGAETVGSILLPKYAKPAVFSGAFSFGASKALGSSTKDAVTNAVSAARTAPVFGAIAQKTDPIITKQLSKLPIKLPNLITSRAAPAVANVAQGVGMDLVTGQQTTPLSLGIDAVTGAVGGKTQFNAPKPDMDAILKRGQALGIDGVSPRVNKVHPEDLDVMREFADKIIRQKGAKQELGELGVSAQRLAEHYFGGKWRTANNKKLAQAFEWAIDLNMNIPREARGQLPKLGLAEDQAQSVMSQFRQQPAVKDTGLKVNQSIPENVPQKPFAVPEAVSKQPELKVMKPEVQASVREADANLMKKVNAFDYFRTPDRVLQKIGLGKQAEEIRTAHAEYQKELSKQINQVTSWYERVGKSPEASQRIFQYLDGKGVALEGEEKVVADEIKQYLSGWADRLGLPQDKRVVNYITHLFDEDFIKKEFDPEIEKLIADQIPGSVYDPFLQKRYGIAGYKEDAFAALDAYVKRATRKIHMDPALESLKKASEVLPLQTWNYVKSYADRINMRPTEVDNLVDTFIKSSPIGYKLGQRPTASITRGLRNAIYRGTLGLNVGSAIRNLTQGVNTYSKLGEKYTGVGYIKALTNMFNKNDELQRVGVLSDSFVQDRHMSAFKGIAEKIDKGLFVFFEAAEKINRGAAYFGAKQKALDSGKTEEQAILVGIKSARDTQFTFGSVDTPVALQSDLIKTLTQFQSFNLKQTEFLGEMIRNKEFGGLMRWLGANTAILLTVGKVMGWDWKDFVPFGGVLDGQSPIGGSPAFTLGKDVLGAAMNSPDKYGNQPSTEDKLKTIGKDLIPLVPGGVQAKKTIQGYSTASKGYSTSPSGEVQFVTPQTTSNKIKGAVLGKSVLPGSKEKFEGNVTNIKGKDAEILKNSDQKQELYNSVIERRKQTNEKDTAKESFRAFIEKGTEPDLSELSPKASAEAVYSLINEIPVKDKNARRELFTKLGKYISPEVDAEIVAISQLDKQGIGVKDREILLMPEPVRAPYIYDRLMDIKDKKERKKKFEAYVKAGLITPAVDTAIAQYAKTK